MNETDNFLSLLAIYGFKLKTTEWFKSCIIRQVLAKGVTYESLVCCDKNYADDNCNRVFKDFITIREGWWAKTYQFSFDH